MDPDICGHCQRSINMFINVVVEQLETGSDRKYSCRQDPICGNKILPSRQKSYPCKYTNQRMILKKNNVQIKPDLMTCKRCHFQTEPTQICRSSIESKKVNQDTDEDMRAADDGVDILEVVDKEDEEKTDDEDDEEETVGEEETANDEEIVDEEDTVEEEDEKGDECPRQSWNTNQLSIRSDSSNLELTPKNRRSTMGQYSLLPEKKLFIKNSLELIPKNRRDSTGLHETRCEPTNSRRTSDHRKSSTTGQMGSISEIRTYSSKNLSSECMCMRSSLTTSSNFDGGSIPRNSCNCKRNIKTVGRMHNQPCSIINYYESCRCHLTIDDILRKPEVMALLVFIFVTIISILLNAFFSFLQVPCRYP